MNSYGHDLPPDTALRATSRRGRWAGRQLDLDGRPDLAALIRAIDASATPTAAAIGRLRFVTSHPWDLSDRLIAAMADCPSVCEHLHLPVQSGPTPVLRRMGRQYTVEHYRERLARDPRGGPGHRRLDRRHRRVLRRDRGAVRGDAGAARDGPLRPGLRRGLLAAAGDARRPASPTTCPPPRSGAASTTLLAPGGDRARARTRRGSGARSRSSSKPSPAAATSDDGARARGSRPDASRSRPDALEHKLVHLAGDPALVGRSSHRSASTRRPVRAARHVVEGTVDAPLAARRRRRPDGDRQDRARDPARGGVLAGRPSRGDHLGRLAPGVPRPGHRHGQGRGRGPGAVRTSASTSSTPTSRSAWPTSAATRGSPGGIAADGGVAILAGGTGLLPPCGGGGLDTDALPSDAVIRAHLEADLGADGPTLAERLARTDAGRAVTSQPAPGRPCPRDRARTGTRAPPPRGYPGPVLAGLGHPVEPRARRRPSTSAPGAVRRRPARRGERAARRSTRECRRSRRSATARPGPSSTATRPGGGDRPSTDPCRVREAPADLVPVASPDIAWLDADGRSVPCGDGRDRVPRASAET